ncbi:MAG: TfoX/Sxy family protein [Candidatus Bathyarchaeota archaeon]|nr:TfoX/Sxy family protein [Candidatus Bathyarchaeota archaeon]
MVRYLVYDKQLDARIRKIALSWKRTDAKNMFGGVCHLLNGNMFCGVYKDFLILRLGMEESKRALELPHVKPFDITGRPMKGWVMVSREGIKTDEELEAWLNKAKEWVKGLPPK